MLLNKYSLELPARFAGDNDSRYILNGVHITPTETVGTNGHYLCRLTHGEMPKDDEFPACGQSGQEASLREPLNIEAESVRAVGKALPKRAKIPVLLLAHLDAHIANTRTGASRSTSPTWKHPKYSVSRKWTGYFQKVDTVMPTGKSADTVWFDPAYLEKIGKAFKDFGVRAVKVETYGSLKVTMFSRTNKDTGQTMQVLLMMPVKLDEQ